MYRHICGKNLKIAQGDDEKKKKSCQTAWVKPFKNIIKTVFSYVSNIVLPWWLWHLHTLIVLFMIRCHVIKSFVVFFFYFFLYFYFSSFYSATLKSVTTYNVCAYFYVCLWTNQQSSYNVNIVVIGSNADMETCEYIISGHTFELRAVKSWS